MKISKKTLIIISIIITAFFFRGLIYRSTVKYKPLKIRKEYINSNSNYTKYIENSIIMEDFITIHSVINKSCEITNNTLKFTNLKCSVNPEKLIKTKETNCVGYAFFFKNTFNHIIKKSNLSKDWKCNVYIGKLFFIGVDIHKYFNSPFFKNHDFIIVENSKTGEKICIDPTVSDYLAINKISCDFN